MRLLLAFALLLSLTCFAQERDSASAHREKDTSSVTLPVIPGEPSPMYDDRELLNATEIRLQPGDVPLHVQKVLQQAKFRGWESGAIYRNEQGTLFKVEVDNDMQRKTYYLDKDGKLIREE